MLLKIMTLPCEILFRSVFLVRYFKKKDPIVCFLKVVENNIITLFFKKPLMSYMRQDIANLVHPNGPTIQ